MKSKQPKRSFDSAAISRIAAILATSNQEAKDFCLRMRASANDPDLPTDMIEWALNTYPRLRSNPKELAKCLPKITLSRVRARIAKLSSVQYKPKPKPQEKPARKKRKRKKSPSWELPPIYGGLPGSGRRS